MQFDCDIGSLPQEDCNEVDCFEDFDIEVS